MKQTFVQKPWTQWSTEEHFCTKLFLTNQRNEMTSLILHEVSHFNQRQAISDMHWKIDIFVISYFPRSVYSKLFWKIISPSYTYWLEYCCFGHFTVSHYCLRQSLFWNEALEIIICVVAIIVRRAGLLLSQQDFEWRWSVPLFQCLTVLEFSFILFDLCLLITFFNFIMNYVPIVTFWIFTYHKIWILSIMFCFIWSYWIIYFLACL